MGFFIAAFMIPFLMLGALVAGKEDLPNRKEETFHRVLKISVRDKKSGVYYRIFTLGDRSSWEVKASNVGLEMKDPDAEYSSLEIEKWYERYHHVTFGYSWNEKERYADTDIVLHLVPCSTYRDTNKFVVKRADSSSEALMGLAYSSNESNREYKLKHERLAMPCLND